MLKFSTVTFSTFCILSFVIPTEGDTIRIALLIITLIIGMFSLRYKIKISILLYLGILLIYYVYNIFIGAINYPETFLQETRVYVFYPLIYLALIPVFKYKWQSEYLHKSIYITTFIFSLYFYYMFLGKIQLLDYKPYDFLKQDFTIAFDNILGFIKIYGLFLLGLSFIVPYVIVSFILRMNKKIVSKLDLIISILAISVTIITLRKGIFIGNIIGIVSAIIIWKGEDIISLLKYFLFFVSLFTIVTIATFLILEKSNISSFKSTLNYIGELDLTTTRTGQIRIEQSKYLFEQWLKNPILGNGFGVKILNYERHPSGTQFELQYLKMLMVIGIIGSMLLLFGYLKFFHVAYLKIKKGEISLYLLPALAGQISVIVANSANPILSQLSAFVMFFMPFYMMGDK